MEALDALAARAVVLACAFERAVHDAGPWGISLDGSSWEPAERLLLPTGVRFRAVFPAMCRVGDGPASAELVCDGQVVSGRALAPPDEAPFEVVWDIGEPAAVGA